MIPKLDPLSEIYETLIMGVRDYVEKNKFGGVIIGISGGIDSALTAAIACDALGKRKSSYNFHAVRFHVPPKPR